MIDKKAILLIGSPKIFKSTSDKLGSFFLKYLEDIGYTTEKVNINVSIRNNALDDLIKLINDSDLLVISTPLYVDSLPAPLVVFLEKYQNSDLTNRKQLIAIVNSGFPEPNHNNSAIEILRLFAKHNNLDWLGGFAIGGGGAFGNVDMAKSPRAQFIRESFRESAIYLRDDLLIPADVFKKASTQVIPARLYTLFGQLGWIMQAIKYRTIFRLLDKPYGHL